jgi:hypothetical protein
MQNALTITYATQRNSSSHLSSLGVKWSQVQILSARHTKVGFELRLYAAVGGPRTDLEWLASRSVPTAARSLCENFLYWDPVSMNCRSDIPESCVVAEGGTETRR